MPKILTMKQSVAALLAVLLPAAVGAARRIDVRARPERLTWSDFREVESIAGSAEDARIAAEMSFPQPLRIEGGADGYRLPAFTITVAPEPSRSVAKRGATRSTSLLGHEQGHFDIVVLAARALARELDAMTDASAQSLTRRVQDAVSKHTARGQRVSDAYDRATAHSHAEFAQGQWQGRIERALRAPAADELEGLPL